MPYRGYHFFIGDLELPYAPSELKVKIGSNNKTTTLINGSEINILKNPKLTEITFEVNLPRTAYPFANIHKRYFRTPKEYTDYFEKLVVDKLPTELVITRPNPSLIRNQLSSAGYYGTGSSLDFESTVLTVSLENYTLNESASNGLDVIVELNFKQYVSYGTVKRVETTKVPETPKPVTKNKSYVVKKGDCLWKISRKFYGTGSKWKTIYNANKTVIEKTARKYGKKSSSNGHWIYPGCKLTIPMTK